MTILRIKIFANSGKLTVRHWFNVEEGSPIFEQNLKG
jgi:hypothetical protein